MSGVEASLRIRVQDFRTRYPPFEQRSESLPPFVGTLTAACEYLIPQPVDALPEGAQLPNISGHRVVLVVAVDDLPKPCTDLARASMHPAAKLDLDGLELRNHPLLRRNTPDGEGIGLVAPPTVVGEAQEGERLWFSRATPLPISGSIAPELDQPGLVRMEFQAELRQPFLELLKEPHSIGSILEAQPSVVSVADDDDIALRHLSAPDIRPQVENVMKVHVSDQR